MSLFIAATGTDIGKTHVACGMIRAARARGQAVQAVKPVASGFDENLLCESDAGQLLAAMDRPLIMPEIARISPWRFAAPLSPDMAARREGRAIDFDQLVAFTMSALGDGITLVEGVGGVMVPLDDERTTLDWMAAVGVPVLLVTGSYLGTLSHTLTAVGALHHADISILALIVNETPGSTVDLGETVETLSRLTDLPALPLPRDSRRQAAVFEGLADAIAAE
ncbi:MAG: dethiobiotin synthase [Candidatus Binataceae bacterium]